eukprot:TRINITY_DN107817_c0_g1_i5.p1 TRINITY_DN107817_c0_g1~~TRINITY_DN107817_c0_g1_i5.p1  ORF type:complete len:946 (-),score=64.44 TRINITY_DN107817_c0_g1_i5:265-3102(-)
MTSHLYRKKDSLAGSTTGGDDSPLHRLPTSTTTATAAQQLYGSGACFSCSSSLHQYHPTATNATPQSLHGSNDLSEQQFSSLTVARSTVISTYAAEECCYCSNSTNSANECSPHIRSIATNKVMVRSQQHQHSSQQDYYLRVWLELIFVFLGDYLDVLSILRLRAACPAFRRYKWIISTLEFSGLRGYDSRHVVDNVLHLLNDCLSPSSPPCHYDFSQCSMFKDSSLLRVSERCSNQLLSLSLDFCYQITDKGLEALLTTPMEKLERLSLRCARNKELIGEPIMRALSAERWPRLHKFNCAFTSLWLEHVEHIAVFCCDRAKELGTEAKLDLSGSWASRCLLEKIGLHNAVKHFNSAVRLRVVDACEKLAKRTKASVADIAERQEHANYCLLQMVKLQGDQLLMNCPCMQQNNVPSEDTNKKAGSSSVALKRKSNNNCAHKCHDDDGEQLLEAALRTPSFSTPSESMRWWTLPLSVAVEGRDTETVGVLLRHGAKVDVWDYLGHSPLYLASKTDQEDVVECLLKHGASVQAYDLNGLTPLNVAIQNYNTDIVEILLDHGAALDHEAPALKSRGYKSPLFIACEQNVPVELVQMLLARGADPNWLDHSRYSPTLLAYQTSPSWLPRFVEAGAGAGNNSRAVILDVLICGVLKNDLSCVKYLTRRYPDLLSMAHHMWSLPHIQAAKLGRSDILRYLLDAGADVNGRGPDGAVALHVATEEGRLDCVMLLLNHVKKPTEYKEEQLSPFYDIDMDTADTEGQSALIIACLENRLTVAEVLLKRGAGINCQTSTNKENALMACIRTRNELMALLLLKFSHSISLDQQDSQGRTALMYAIYFGQYLIADKLLARGANVAVQDHDGVTPYAVMLNRITSGTSQQAKLCRKVARLYRSAIGASKYNRVPAVAPADDSLSHVEKEVVGKATSSRPWLGVSRRLPACFGSWNSTS